MNIYGINGTQGVAPVRQVGAAHKNDAAQRTVNTRDEMNISTARETSATNTNANSDIRLDLVNHVRAIHHARELIFPSRYCYEYRLSRRPT